jgi:hypothetical protein
LVICSSRQPAIGPVETASAAKLIMA